MRNSVCPFVGRAWRSFGGWGGEGIIVQSGPLPHVEERPGLCEVEREGWRDGELRGKLAVGAGAWKASEDEARRNKILQSLETNADGNCSYSWDVEADKQRRNRSARGN